jgi:hypothetical protein
MQDPKSLDDAFSAAIARVQVEPPNPIEAILKAAISRAQVGQLPIEPHPSKRVNNNKSFRERGTNGFTLLVSKALYDQLERFRAENDMPRAKVIRRAVYEMMRNPKQTAPRLPKLTYAPKRNVSVGWSLSRDREELDTICADMNITASEFQRKAIYLYTKANVSTDATEAREAAADGWGIPNT